MRVKRLHLMIGNFFKTVAHVVDTSQEVIGRGERIRTSGLYVPNVALYQAKLHPDFGN